MPDDQVPVFYINVATRTDRRDFMESQFAALGIPGERVEAELPSDVPPEVVAAAQRLDGTLSIGLGEIACTLSHFAAWQRAIDRGAAACAVLEDDAVLSRQLPRFLQQLGSVLPDGVDLLKFETTRISARLGQRERGIGDFIMRPLAGTHLGNCGYVISTVLAARLIASMPLAPLPLDDYLFGRGGEVLYSHHIYQVTPALAVQLNVLQAPVDGGTAASDLEHVRNDRRRNQARISRLRRTGENVALAWREFATFGCGVLRRRAPVPFADDP